jgi:hypothetical protein
MALARWGLWLSVLFGLGYGTYRGATDFAVRRQAEDFLLDENKGFFAKLKTPGQINAAFLLTRPPDLREDINPNNEEQVQRLFARVLPGFVNSNLVRFIRQGGKDTEVEIQDIKTCTYREGGYWVDVEVAITTPDEFVLYPLTVRSRDSGTGREWFVDWNRVPERPKKVEPTQRGDDLMNLRMASHQYVLEWLRKLNGANLKPSDFHPEKDGLTFVRVRDEKQRELVRKVFGQLCDPNASDRPVMRPTVMCCKGEDQKGPVLAYYTVNKDKNRLEITHEIRLMFGAMVNGQPQPLMCFAKLIVQRTDSGLLTYDPDRLPSWRIVRMEISQVADPTRDQRPS